MNSKETEADVFRFLKEVLSNCPLLERCVLNTYRNPKPIPSLVNSGELKEFLLKFVTKLKKLTVLCLNWCFVLCHDTTKAIENWLASEILPQRPALWFHLGLISRDNLDIPRVLLDEMIYPVNYVFAPPKFWS